MIVHAVQRTIEMSGDYSDSLKRRIDSLSLKNKLETHFIYPQLVVVCEDKILVLPSETTSEDDKVYELDDLVTDTLVQDNLLWIVLASGKVSVLNVLHGSYVKIELQNFTSYKIQKLKLDSNNVHFISESEEHLVSTCTPVMIYKEMNEGMSELQLAVEKVRSHPIAFLRRQPSANIHGLNVFIEKGSVVSECTMTGFRELITSAGLDLQHILAWNELLVLADNSNMWVVDIVNNCVVLVFNTVGVQYLPLGTYQDKLYYLFLDHEEVCTYKMFLL